MTMNKNLKILIYNVNSVKNYIIYKILNAFKG